MIVAHRPASSCRRLAAYLVACLTLLAVAALHGGLARAASTGTTALLMPQGSLAESQDGDYISSSVASGPSGPNCPGPCNAVPLNTIYRYYVEVPAGLSRLRVQVFDADVGAGGATEATAQRDRSRSGTFTTKAKYTLLRPDGTSAATQTCGNTATAFCADNAWASLFDTTTNVQAGHWELDVDQSSAVNGAGTTDINAFGIRADDGNQPSGTELPVYYLAQNQIGQNIPSGGTAGTKSYTFYPYVTSGCSFNEDDFDYDLGNNATGGMNQNVGSIDFTSRSASFTKNFAAASLSGNDVWATNAVSGYTTDSDATDYGVWKMVAGISNYTNNAGINGNYANIYIGNSSATTPPANNSPTPNTFRVYFPTDAGSAPVKPYMEQVVRYVGGSSGPNPPVVGMTTIFVVTVLVVNPTAHAITFSNTNLVTANVPGAGAVYGGNAAASQGTVTAQPAVGGTGNVTWNPGTLAAGDTELVSYQVKVTPTSTGQRIPVVGTVASGNGTKGIWVDETGSTTQARATLTFGPLCELAATQGVVSAAEVTDLHARAGDRGVVVEWQTAAEIGAAGFDLYRFDATGSRQKVNHSLVPSLIGTPQGGTYRVLDESAPAAPAIGALRYEVVEIESSGATRRYPFAVPVEPAGDGAAVTLPASGAERSARRDPVWEARRAAAATAPAPQTAAAAGAETEAMERPENDESKGQRLKIGVREDGLYRISPAVVGGAFSGSASPTPGKRPGSQFSLTNQGQPVATTTDTDGSILFYGQAPHSIYTLDNVYWLRPGAGAVMLTESGGNPTATGSPTASFTAAAHSQQQTFAATAVPADPESDYWYWSYLIAGDPATGSGTFAAAAPNVNAAGSQVTVHLKGATDSHHHVQVSLNGAALGDTSWSGIADQSATFAASALDSSGTNTVTLTALLDAGVSTSIVYVQSIDISYERAFSAVGDALAFNGSGNALVTVSGFSGSAIHLLDLTDPRQPALVTGARIDTTPAGSAAGATRLTFVPSAPSTPYLAAGPQAVRAPAWVQLAVGKGLADRPGGADYLVLTTHDLMPGATALAALRSSQGLRTAVVDVAEVMDSFSFGLSNPHAIQSFLAHVRSAWNPVPRYLVLAGGGTFDYRNLLGFGGEKVPPLMLSTDAGLFAADNHLADLDGDGVPDFAVGRLPVASNAELLAYVAKLATYEATPGSGWNNLALMLADQPGPEDGQTNYAADSIDLVAALPGGYSPQQIAITSATVAASRSALFAGLNAGAGLVNFLGHAGLDRLSPLNLLTSSDAVTLSNGPRLPLMAALTCNVNRFDVPGFSSLGELLANQPNGGAVAVWSSSGLSVQPAGKELARQFYLALANPANQRLGDAMQQALNRYAGGAQSLVTTLNFYTLLGDPATLLKPVQPAAASGSASTHQE